ERIPWDKQGSITAPAIGVPTEIWKYAVPDGMYLVLRAIRHGYAPGPFVEGGGSIIWVIDVDNPIGNPLQTWRPVAQFTSTVGSRRIPWPVGPLQFRGGDVLRYKVLITDPAVPVGVPNTVTAIALGWL